MPETALQRIPTKNDKRKTVKAVRPLRFREILVPICRNMTSIFGVQRPHDLIKIFLTDYPLAFYVMMLESKGILPHDATDCSALRASTILKIFKIRPNRAAFSCFYGSQSHVYSCKHESHNLLTPASCNMYK